jgi:hypothetical protein
MLYALIVAATLASARRAPVAAPAFRREFG